MNTTPQNGWYPDPTGRHEQRFWDGTQWTDHVATGNTRSVDPLFPATQSVQADQTATHSATATSVFEKVKEGAQAATLAAMGLASTLTSTDSERTGHDSPTGSPFMTSSGSTQKDRVLPTAQKPVPKAAGWYPNPATEGGTRYSDGTEWTGDVRPPRMPFAAPCSMAPMQYLLPFIALIYIFLLIMGGNETGDYSGVFWASLVFIGVLVLSVWMGRGRGPSTAEVINRIAVEQKEAKARRRSANIASFFSNFGRRAPASATNFDPNLATAAQINAISDPDTARALQNLQNLLYTQALTDEEFQSAKDKLLGPSTAVSQFEQLEQLAELHRQGILGDIEFASAKARVLGI